MILLEAVNADGHRFPHEAGWYVATRTDAKKKPQIESSKLTILVLLPTRTRLLLDANHSCYRPRRTGERKRKSVRGGTFLR